MRLYFPLLLALALLGQGLQAAPPSAHAETASVTSKIAPALLARMTADPTRLEPVIVEMEHAAAAFGAQPGAQLAQQALTLITGAGGVGVGALPIVCSAAGWLDAAGINALSSMGAVAYIHEDSTVQPQPATAGG